MAEKLQEMATAGALTGLNRRYLSAEGMQALIDRIALLKKGLADEDSKLREDLTKLITDLQNALKENTDNDAAREVRLATAETNITNLQNDKADKTDLDDYLTKEAHNTFVTDEFTPVKGDVATNKTDIKDLQDNKADKTEIKDWVLTSTYNTFIADEFTPLKNKVAELITILADVVTGAQVDEAATAAGLPEAPAEEPGA